VTDFTADSLDPKLPMSSMFAGRSFDQSNFLDESRPRPGASYTLVDPALGEPTSLDVEPVDAAGLT